MLLEYLGGAIFELNARVTSYTLLDVLHESCLLLFDRLEGIHRLWQIIAWPWKRLLLALFSLLCSNLA
jgi:hypothetical protein